MPMMATNQRMCAEYASAFGRLDGWERVTKIYESGYCGCLRVPCVDACGPYGRYRRTRQAVTWQW